MPNLCTGTPRICNFLTVHCFQHLVQQNNSPKRALKRASAVNKTGTGQRPIICQVVALCSQSRSCLRQDGVPEGTVH